MTHQKPSVPLRVLVIDPYPPLCHAIVEILREGNMIARGAYQPEDTLRLIVDFQPHILVIELGPSPRAGLLEVRRVRDRHPRLPVLVHTAALYAASTLGPDTRLRVVPKGATSTEGLLEGIEAVRPGDLERVPLLQAVGEWQ